MAFQLGLEGQFPFIYVYPFTFQKELMQFQNQMQDFYLQKDGVDGKYEWFIF